MLNETDSLNYFIARGRSPFTRKDYMNVFKNSLSATATWDFKKGLEKGLFSKKGEGNQSKYFLCDKEFS